MSITVKTKKLLIIMSNNTQIPKDVYPWEMDVIEAKFPQFTDLGEGEKVIAEPPSAAEQFARMDGAYGRDEAGQPYVEVAFGRGKKGIAKLEKAINKACGIKPAPADDEDAQPKPQRGRPRKEVQDDDPLS